VAELHLLLDGLEAAERSETAPARHEEAGRELLRWEVLRALVRVLGPGLVGLQVKPG
jgi:hypothetical protein